MTTGLSNQIQQLCARFCLPTVVAEVVPRCKAAHQSKALVTLLEVLQLEDGDRRQRRVDRLRWRSACPEPGRRTPWRRWGIG
jgi:hypothetical protein